MKDFLAEKQDFKFPLFVNRGALASVKMPGENLLSWKVHKLGTASEVQSFLSGSTYVIVNFYSDYASRREDMGICLAEQASKHSVTGILEFVRANKSDM